MNRFRWEGLEEFKTFLKQLPVVLTAGARTNATEAANGATADIRAGYPPRAASLGEQLTVEAQDVGPFGVRLVVTNISPVAWWFENGTQARHTVLGANRGSMPPAHVFVPRIVRWRRRMDAANKAMMEANGLTVTGDA